MTDKWIVIRLPLTGALAYWVWTGSRIAVIIWFALFVLDREVLNLWVRRVERWRSR